MKRRGIGLVSLALAGVLASAMSIAVTAPARASGAPPIPDTVTYDSVHHAPSGEQNKQVVADVLNRGDPLAAAWLIGDAALRQRTAAFHLALDALASHKPKEVRHEDHRQPLSRRLAAQNDGSRP